MTSAVCAFCNRYSHLTPVWAEKIPITNSGGAVVGTMIQGVAKCDHCKRTSLATSTAPSNHGSTHMQMLEATDDSTLTWYPRAGDSPKVEDVPRHIAAAAKEAHICVSVGAVMAAILMARTVVEATAKDKGITKGQLWAKIDEMKNAELIRKSTAEAAHEIRHFGNDMAHGDIADLPDAEDAAAVLELMDEVLNEVCQGPARTKRIKDKRNGTAVSLPGVSQ